MNARIHRPIPLVGGRPFRTHADRRVQPNRLEDRIQNVAAHIAERAGAEV